MQLLSLSTSSLSIKENTTIFDDGSIADADIYLSPGLDVGYVFVSSENILTKRRFLIGSDTLFNGYGIYIWTDMVSQMSVNIDGDNTKANLSLLALASEGSHIQVDGIGKVEMGSENITLRVDQTNILLGNKTSVQGKPVLEIATDSINGGHSCKVHRISGEALFYLQSHGIDQKSAEWMLLDAEIRRHLTPLDEEKKEIQQKEIQQKLGLLKQ